MVCLISKIHLVIFLLILIIQSSNGLKILVQVMTGGNSHVKHVAAMVDSLVDRGHVVDVLVPIHNPMCKINGSMKYRKMFMVKHNGMLPFHKVPYLNKPFDQTFHTKFDPAITESTILLCEDTLNNHQMMEEMQAEHYDVGLFGAITSCFAGILHLLKIKSYHGYMPLSYDGVYQTLGIPVPASYISGAFSIINKRTQMSFFERAQSLIAHWKFNYYMNELLEQENELFQSRYKNFPHMRDIFKNMTYYIENSDPILSVPQPYSEKVKFIGGISVKPVEPLSNEYHELLNQGERGVILFSFGSLLRIEQVPLERQYQILDAFKQFKNYLFLWKHEKPEMLASKLINVTNVKLVQWLPQNDLLNDKRVKLFITHTGANSYMEAMRAAVPLIAIPLFADQPQNAAAAEEKGVAVVIQPKLLNTDTLSNAIRELLENEKYRNRAQEMSRRLKRKNPIAKDHFVNLIEYAAEHPTLGQDLQLAGHDMSMFKYFCLDVIIFFTLSLIASIYLTYRLFRVLKRVLNFVRLKVENKKTKSE